MASSLYKRSIPIYVRYLQNLSGILTKGLNYANEKGIKQEDMIQHRLIADMRGLAYQVTSACDTAKFTAQRVGGNSEHPFPDDETTFEQLQERISKTIKILEEADPKGFDGKEDAEVIMVTRSMGSFRFTGSTYVDEYATPNFHFHLTTAYCLLRQQGVPIAAFDYLKGMLTKV